ncbi:PDZ domain-containing protein, partial [Embleya sp. NPDC059213]|uniref:PDZ domain-containing protein n=1 Tax=Embleya sp. NPDC059213 TaxID=3346771 RepID=UPI00369F3E3C
MWSVGSSGRTAGLRPGDVLTAINGRPTPNISAYCRALNNRRAGATFPFTIQRAGRTLTLQVTLYRTHLPPESRGWGGGEPNTQGATNNTTPRSGSG